MTTRHLLAFPLLLLFFLSYLFIACNNRYTPLDCDAPKVSAAPGCEPAPAGDITLASEGCYVPCTQEGAPCASGGSCKKVWINPCNVCASEAACCDACGGEELFCLP